jgi:hypothetical protein
MVLKRFVYDIKVADLRGHTGPVFLRKDVKVPQLLGPFEAPR